MSVHRHEFTTLISDELDLEWEWCTRCGAVRHAGATFTPGAHQRETIVPDSDIPIPDDLTELAERFGFVVCIERGTEVDDDVWGVMAYGGAAGDDLVATGSNPLEAIAKARAIMLTWE